MGLLSNACTQDFTRFWLWAAMQIIVICKNAQLLLGLTLAIIHVCVSFMVKAGFKK